MKPDGGNMMLSAGIWATACLDGYMVKILGGLKSIFHLSIQFLHQPAGSRDTKIAGF